MAWRERFGEQQMAHRHGSGMYYDWNIGRVVIFCRSRHYYIQCLGILPVSCIRCLSPLGVMNNGSLLVYMNC